MKVLYAVQGTGNGHLARARTLVPIIARYAEVDVLVSGSQVEIDLGFPIAYKFHGLGFVFGKNGGVSIPQTLRSIKLLHLIKDWRTINLNNYDFIINDFEPIVAWKSKWGNKPCLGFSHQRAVLHPKAPRTAKKDLLGEFILKHYAPTKAGIGFHFTAYDAHTQTPIVRDEIRALKPEKCGHYTVYLPAYSSETLVEILQQIPAEWQVFSKHNKTEERHANVWVRPVNSAAFVESMRTADGVLCGAGFETPAEALFWDKKLMVIPMANQYEQQLNAESLRELGVPTLDMLNHEAIPHIQSWIAEEAPIDVSFPDNAEQAVKELMRLAIAQKARHIKRKASSKSRLSRNAF